jgi:four helix bundle protein
MEIAVTAYALTRDPYFAQPGDLRSQLRRAALSISNNIAEGFERGSTSELLAFLYIARGSAGEVRSMLHFLERDSTSEHLKSKIAQLQSSTENCSRQIRGWADHLQNSNIQGQRHLTEKTRKDYQRANDAAAFMKQLEALTQGSRTRLDSSEESRGSAM